VKYSTNVAVLEQEVYAQLSSELEGAILAGGAPPLSAKNIPGIKRFLKELSAENKAGDSDADPKAMTLFGVQAWGDVQAIASVATTLAAAKKPINKVTFLRAFRAAKNIDLLGLNHSWTPGHYVGVPGYPHVSNPFEWQFIVRNGALQLLGKAPFDVSTVVGKGHAK
jgi:hypothetical protein